MKNSGVRLWFNNMTTHGHANQQMANAFHSRLCGTQFEFQLHSAYHDRFLMVQISIFRPLSQQYLKTRNNQLYICQYVSPILNMLTATADTSVTWRCYNLTTVNTIFLCCDMFTFHCYVSTYCTHASRQCVCYCNNHEYRWQCNTRELRPSSTVQTWHMSQPNRYHKNHNSTEHVRYHRIP
jgi:hypothetical protein